MTLRGTTTEAGTASVGDQVEPVTQVIDITVNPYLSPGGQPISKDFSGLGWREVGTDRCPSTPGMTNTATAPATASNGSLTPERGQYVISFLLRLDEATLSYAGCTPPDSGLPEDVSVTSRLRSCLAAFVSAQDRQALLLSVIADGSAAEARRDFQGTCAQGTPPGEPSMNLCWTGSLIVKHVPLQLSP